MTLIRHFLVFIAGFLLPPKVSSYARSFVVKNQISHFGILKAGGFEWEDPTKSWDQGVENPFKNPDLMNGEDGFKIDPARLLGPRLNGANIYFIGMMGCGKTSVGDCVARRKSDKHFFYYSPTLRKLPDNSS
jgi:hypothetical protein